MTAVILNSSPSSSLPEDSSSIFNQSSLEVYQQELIDKINLAKDASANIFISFSVEDINFCIKNSQVCEFVSMKNVGDLTSLYTLPQNNNYILGLINYQSKILCVLSLAQYLNAPTPPLSAIAGQAFPDSSSYSRYSGLLIFQTGDIYFAVLCEHPPSIVQLNTSDYDFLEMHDITQFSSFDKIMLSLAHNSEAYAKRLKKLTKSIIINKALLSKFLNVIPSSSFSHLTELTDSSTHKELPYIDVLPSPIDYKIDYSKSLSIDNPNNLDLSTAIELKPTENLALILDLMDKPN